jgi:hypothetical protein
LNDIEEQPFFDNLPRLSQPDGVDEIEGDFEWNQSPGPSNNRQVEAQRFRIDCMDYVWSMTFGSGISRSKNNVTKRRRFSFNSDLILVTGLQGGKIKVWNVYTGNDFLKQCFLSSQYLSIIAH